MRELKREVKRLRTERDIQKSPAADRITKTWRQRVRIEAASRRYRTRAVSRAAGCNLGPASPFPLMKPNTKLMFRVAEQVRELAR